MSVEWDVRVNRRGGAKKAAELFPGYYADGNHDRGPLQC